MPVTRFPTNPCFAAQLPLGELTQLAQCLVSLPSPLSMWSSRVPSRSRFVLILVNVSVTALPLAFRRARANRDSDLPLSFHLRLALGRWIRSSPTFTCPRSRGFVRQSPSIGSRWWLGNVPVEIEPYIGILLYRTCRSRGRVFSPIMPVA